MNMKNHKMSESFTLLAENILTRTFQDPLRPREGLSQPVLASNGRPKRFQQCCWKNPKFRKRLPDEPRTSRSKSVPNSTRRHPAVTTRASEIEPNSSEPTSGNLEIVLPQAPCSPDSPCHPFGAWDLFETLPE